MIAVCPWLCSSRPAVLQCLQTCAAAVLMMAPGKRVSAWEFWDASKPSLYVCAWKLSPLHVLCSIIIALGSFFYLYLLTSRKFMGTMQMEECRLAKDWTSFLHFSRYRDVQRIFYVYGGPCWLYTLLQSHEK